MSRIRTLIVDDEAPARAKVRRLLHSHSDMEIVGEATTGGEALRLVREMQPDLLLLDVRMPAPDGMAVIRELRDAGGPLPYVVFLTAYGDYAVEAFEVHALDYLVKPFDRARFDRAIQRARDALRRGSGEVGPKLDQLLANLPPAAPYLDRLLVRKGEKALLLPIRDVDWVEAARNYVILHAAGQSYMVRGTLREMDRRLDPQRFIRIHRSHIVNLDRIRELHPWSHGDYQVVLTDGTRLMLSRRFRDRLPGLRSS